MDAAAAAAADDVKPKYAHMTKHQRNLLLADMERMICRGTSDFDMIKHFGLTERSFYYFKRKLYKQSLELQTSRKTEEVITFETKILKERLTKVYWYLEQRLEAMHRDPKLSDNVADIAAAAFQIGKSIMQLEMEGMRSLSMHNQSKYFKYVNNVSQNYYDTTSRSDLDNGDGNLLQQQQPEPEP